MKTPSALMKQLSSTADKNELPSILKPEGLLKDQNDKESR